MHIFIASNQQTCKAIISIYLCCIGGYIQSSQEPATAPADDEFLNITAKTVTSSCSRNSNISKPALKLGKKSYNSHTIAT
jgi:hypothetical protein